MDPDKIHIRYGVIISFILIGYFLIVKLFGLHENSWLRLINGGIVAYGIYAVIRYKKLLEEEGFQYYSGFKTGIYTGFLATLIFAAFMSVYMFHLDPTFAENVMQGWVSEYNQGPGILLFVLVIEGFASTVILTLTFMQKFKPSWNIRKSPQKA